MVRPQNLPDVVEEFVKLLDIDPEMQISLSPTDPGL